MVLRTAKKLALDADPLWRILAAREYADVADAQGWSLARQVDKPRFAGLH
jgi:hypothetical protein